VPYTTVKSLSMITIRPNEPPYKWLVRSNRQELLKNKDQTNAPHT
jgi:hypothetical protein